MPITIEYDAFESPASSAIFRVAVGFDASTTWMEVTMRKRDKNSRRIVYGYNITGNENLYQKFEEAPSKGKYYVSVVKKQLDYVYKFRR